jgi:hypothetical protein
VIRYHDEFLLVLDADAVFEALGSLAVGGKLRPGDAEGF